MNCNVVLNNGEASSSIEVNRFEYFSLPRISRADETFLGWSRFEKLNYGYMNFCTDSDTELFAVFSNGPTYVVESFYRGEKDNYTGFRCRFRRYVVDIYLENARAKSGRFKLYTPSNVLYYLGFVPVNDINLTVNADTDFHGHAYNGYAEFTTQSVEVNWESKTDIDTFGGRVHIARLMFNFSRWGLGYNEIERRTSDDMVSCAWDYRAVVGESDALVSANFYNGIVPEEELPSVENDTNVSTVISEQDLPNTDKGELLTRFAILSDSHIGYGYNWQNYDWLYGVFNHLENVHSQTSLDFVVQLGDNINDGYQNTFNADYEVYLDAIKRLNICDAENPIDNRKAGTIPNYELQGNHDTSLETRFFRKKLWYSQNNSGKKTAFIGLFAGYGGYPAVNCQIAGNTRTYHSFGIINDEMSEFVENSIVEAKNEGVVHIVLCCHFGISQALYCPILPESGYGKIEGLCKKYGIKLFLSGHEHNTPYTLRKCGDLYNYDAAATFNGYSVVELYEKAMVTRIYNTKDNSLKRIDIIGL